MAKFRALIVEDDFISRTVLQKYLGEYAQCDIAINGKEAVLAFRIALDDEEPYALILLDIMMPKMDGQQVLKEVRKLEHERGLYGSKEVKIIMITALDDPENIMKAFKSECESYLPKPVKKEKLLDEVRNLGLL